jgi:hypothetical protein
MRNNPKFIVAADATTIAVLPRNTINETFVRVKE